MTQEERQVYDKMFETFATEGWGFIRERLQEMYSQQNNVLAIGDEKGFWQQRGSLGMLHLMIELEAVLEGELAQSEENEDVE